MAGLRFTVFEMITTPYMPRAFSHSLLKQVQQQLIEWQFEPVAGRGLWSKHDSIAYVEVKIYEEQAKEYGAGQVVWNISDTQLPKYQPTCKADIEEGLRFFLWHLAALKGEPIDLTFEINDLAFHDTCARHYPFKNAVIYAIIDCFDKSLVSPHENTIRILQRNGEGYE